MIKHPASHVDHDLTEAQVDFLMKQFADRDSFFIATIELPEQLGTVPCGLFGPILGDAPIADGDVTLAKRGTRTWESRLIDRAPRPVRTLTVIAGPHEETCMHCQDGLRMSLAIPSGGSSSAFYRCETCKGTGKIQHDCILYTAFGGPLAPQEPGDPGCKDPAASALFWRDHALAK
jgi:hypothetical protein